jgi:hypothetical protein
MSAHPGSRSFAKRVWGVCAVTYRSDESRRAESAPDVAPGERVRVEQRSGPQDFGCSDPALSLRVAGPGCFPQRMRYSRGGLKRVAASTRSATYDQGPNSGISFPTGMCRRQSRTLTSPSLAVVHQFPQAQLEGPQALRIAQVRGLIVISRVDYSSVKGGVGDPPLNLGTLDELIAQTVHTVKAA